MKWRDVFIFSISPIGIGFFTGLALFVWAMYAIVAYSPKINIPHYDNEVRRSAFDQCMKLLPAGPNETHYNDWSEVVGECRGYADRMAYIQQ